jgi:hypothetical protein
LVATFEERSTGTEDSEGRLIWAAEFPDSLLNPIETKVRHILISRQSRPADPAEHGLRTERSLPVYALVASCQGFTS